MITLVANKSIMRSKFKKALLANFDLMLVLKTNKAIMRSKLKKALLANFDLMIEVLTSCLKLSNFIEKCDIMKKANFGLMKFNLMIICHFKHPSVRSFIS